MESTNDIILDYLMIWYKENKAKGDIYRARAYYNAYDTISKVPFIITSVDDVRHLKGIGAGIAKKIQAILAKGTIVFASSERKRRAGISPLVSLFTSIHGVGEKIALKWIRNGNKSLEDVVANEKLTHAQQVSIFYYNDIMQKIPRKQIELLETRLTDIVKILNKIHNMKIVFYITGSYRRQKSESNDIDCLFAEKDNNSIDDIIIDALYADNILVEDLSHGKNKYMGICIDKSGIHRRIDLEFCPDYDILPYELLYFTGSKYMNIYMRQKAKENKMVLNQKGLFKKGKLLSANSERDIFRYLDMKYIEPNER